MSESPVPAPSPSVDFRLNVGTYHSGAEADGWLEARFDLYTPADPPPSALPVVVMFHGAPGVVEKASLHSLATAVAEAGALVMVPNWGNIRWASDAVEARARGLATADAAACAVSYALTYAAGHGGDPDRLALVGSSAGANTASLVGLRDADPYAPCAVDPQPFRADALVLWEGDWSLATTVWDRYGAALPTVMEGFTPWTWLDPSDEPAVILVTTPGGRASERRCQTAPGAAWLTDRDPDGALTQRLEAIGAFDDGCIDVGEPTTVLAGVLREYGLDVQDLVLEGSGHSVLRSAQAGKVVDALFAALDR